METARDFTNKAIYFYSIKLFSLKYKHKENASNPLSKGVGYTGYEHVSYINVNYEL